MTVTNRIDELRRLAEQTTPGPWILRESSPIDVVGADGMEVAESFPEERGAKQGQADAAYIAAASPDAILSLLDDLEQAHALAGMGAGAVELLNGRVAVLEEFVRDFSEWAEQLETFEDADEDAYVHLSVTDRNILMEQFADQARALLQDKDKVTP